MTAAPDHPPAARRPRRAGLRASSSTSTPGRGASPSSTTDTGISFLAAEGSPEQYVVRLREAADKRIDLIAFGAAHSGRRRHAGPAAGRDGVQLVSEPGALQTPGGGYGFRFFDNEGRTVEVSSDVAVRQHRKIEEGESVPVRLSHVVINSADPEGTVRSTSATWRSRCRTP